MGLNKIVMTSVQAILEQLPVLRVLKLDLSKGQNMISIVDLRR